MLFDWLDSFVDWSSDMVKKDLVWLLPMALLFTIVVCVAGLLAIPVIVGVSLYSLITYPWRHGSKGEES